MHTTQKAIADLSESPPVVHRWRMLPETTLTVTLSGRVYFFTFRSNSARRARRTLHNVSVPLRPNGCDYKSPGLLAKIDGAALAMSRQLPEVTIFGWRATWRNGKPVRWAGRQKVTLP